VDNSGEIDYHEFLHTFGTEIQKNRAPPPLNVNHEKVRLKGSMGSINIDKVIQTNPNPNPNPNNRDASPHPGSSPNPDNLDNTLTLIISITP